MPFAPATPKKREFSGATFEQKHDHVGTGEWRGKFGRKLDELKIKDARTALDLLSFVSSLLTTQRKADREKVIDIVRGMKLEDNRYSSYLEGTNDALDNLIQKLDTGI